MRIDRHVLSATAVAAAAAAIVLLLVRRERARPAHPSFEGQAMGTTYRVRLAFSPLSSSALAKLHRRMKARLADLEAQMSLFQPSSEISRFNRNRSTEAFPVSSDFDHVVYYALQLARRSDGAFDPTVAPLVNLWGFGPERRGAPPTDDEIEAARARVGYRGLEVLSQHRLRKQRPDLELDLGGIAKGYAADELARVLLRAGLTNFLVEIGGEAVAWGCNPQGQPWRIGVQYPEYGAVPGQRLVGTIRLSGGAVATSGDYQNFWRDATGRVRSHIIDPRTGRPVEHDLACVTVVASRCLDADGLATAAFVLGPEVGLALVEEYSGAEGLFLVRQPDGDLAEKMTSRFREVTGYERVEGGTE